MAGRIEARSATAVGRVLLVVNEASGVGHGRGVVEGLRSALAGSLAAGVEGRVEVVRDHAEARGRVAAYLAGSRVPALVVVGGGNGTLRAAIEGLCAETGGPPGPERARVGALRMGSGNPLARRFGAAADAEETLRGILRNASAGRVERCSVLRCVVGVPSGVPGAEPGGTEPLHATTMVGLGLFGRVPGDIERWRRRAGGLRAALARVAGIERVNAAEYVVATLLRCVRCAIAGERAAERVEVRVGGRREVMRLLAGVVMNHSVQELPIDPGVGVEDEEAFVALVPYAGRLSALRLVLTPRGALRGALRARISGDRGLEISLLDRERVEFFLDEDPAQMLGGLSVVVAGSVAIVPGPLFGEEEGS